MQRSFHQLKSDIRSCRCKNFSLKQTSGLKKVVVLFGGGGGGGSSHTDPHPESATEVYSGGLELPEGNNKV